MELECSMDFDSRAQHSMQTPCSTQLTQKGGGSMMDTSTHNEEGSLMTTDTLSDGTMSFFGTVLKRSQPFAQLFFTSQQV